MTRRALIIGASGGIGAALCETLAGQGFETTGLSRSATGLDLTDTAQIDRNMRDLTGPFDRILFASGILAPEGARPEKSLAEIEAEHMAQVMAVNAIGLALILSRIPKLLPRNRPSVVGALTARIGSISDNNLGGWYSYRAAKAAANQIVRTAAIEIARTHKEAIVVALHPGTVATSFTKAYPSYSKVSPREAAQNLCDVIDQLTRKQNGGFFDWAGEPIPW